MRAHPRSAWTVLVILAQPLHCSKPLKVHAACLLDPLGVRCAACVSQESMLHPVTVQGAYLQNACLLRTRTLLFLLFAFRMLCAEMQVQDKLRLDFFWQGSTRPLTAATFPELAPA